MILHYRRTLWILLYISVLCASVIFIGSGCATHESSTRRTETRSVENTQPVYPSSQQGTVQTTQTDTEHIESKEEPHGVLSSALHFVGAVLAFPFKVIAAAIGAIF